MKKLALFLTLCLSVNLISQDFTGKATYKTSRKTDFKINNENGKLDDKMQEEIQQRIQKMHQKTYFLEFDKNTSTYKEQEKLDAPQPNATNGAVVRVMSFGGSGANDVYYKDITNKRFVNQTEIMGKQFLIKDQLPQYDWEMSTETKNIGNYTCYKAEYTRDVENTKVSVVNSETKEEKVKETITTIAWYTPQIPVSNGPGNYQGLPGLILEINDGKNLIVCTEIVLNPSEKISIEVPKKGKEVNQAEFDKIEEEKSKEMLEKFKSRNGVDMGNGINIKIGG